MSKSIRDLRQEEFAKVWLKSKHGILLLAPRFGKIRTTINILEKLNNPTILIAYPDNKIKDSWQSDFEERQYDDSNVTYTTHLSLKKHIKQEYDIVIIDECHLLSEAQIEVCKELFKINSQILGLTGTLSKNTEDDLNRELGLYVLAHYPIKTAIDEGVIVDYQITVISVPLDNKTMLDYKGKLRTEKKQFDNLTWVVNKMTRSGNDSMFMRLARMRVIQSSLAKTNATKALLAKYKNERVLVFCGTTKVADSLGIPSYHSKSSEKLMFADFAEGRGNHMAVVKIGNTGVTFSKLNRVVINSFDSNPENLTQKIFRCMAMDYDNLEKKAYICIVSTTESVELKWLSNALSAFDLSKIKYV